MRKSTVFAGPLHQSYRLVQRLSRIEAIEKMSTLDHYKLINFATKYTLVITGNGCKSSHFHLRVIFTEKKTKHNANHVWADPNPWLIVRKINFRQSLRSHRCVRTVKQRQCEEKGTKFNSLCYLVCRASSMLIIAVVKKELMKNEVKRVMAKCGCVLPNINNNNAMMQK